MNIKNKVAVITGASGGIGQEVCIELARRQARFVAMVDASDAVYEAAKLVNKITGDPVAQGFKGDVTNDEFRQSVYQELHRRFGCVNICVPAAGITRDALAVKVDKETGDIHMYPIETFRQVMEVNLIAPIYWALEMVAGLSVMRRKAE